MFSEPLDAGTAALVGALIGASTGLFGPWLRDVSERRARRRDFIADERRTEIVRTVEAFALLLKERQREEFFGSAPDLSARHTDAVLAGTRLSILTTQKDWDVARLTEFVVETISDERVVVGEAALGAFHLTVLAWHQGTLRGKKIGDQFSETYKRLLAERVKKPEE